MLRYIAKILLFVIAVCGYLLTSFALSILRRDPVARRAALSNNICRWAKVGLKILGMEVEIIGPFDPTIFARKNYLVVCNHLSYSDVIVLASAFPSVFVTSVEVRDSAFVGLMSAFGGCVFVERRSRDNIEGEIGEISAALRAGLNVVIFPEATSSNGDSVLPFKRSLLKAAIDAQVDILPLTISYPKVNGEPITAELRNQVCYFGKRDFFDHLKFFLTLKSLTARLQFTPEVKVEQMVDRKAIADKAYEQILEAYTNRAYNA